MTTEFNENEILKPTLEDCEQENSILWDLIQQHWIQGRHLDSQRTNMSRLTLAVSAGVLGLVAYNGLDFSDLPLTIFLILVGIYGGVFSAKYDNHFYMHMQYARIYRRLLDTRFPSLSFEKAIKERKKRYNNPGPTRKKPSFKEYWMLFHFSIALFGLLLTILIIFHPGSTSKAQAASDKQIPIIVKMERECAEINDKWADRKTSKTENLPNKKEIGQSVLESVDQTNKKSPTKRSTGTKETRLSK